MKRNSLKPFLVIVCALFVVLSISTTLSKKIRSTLISFVFRWSPPTPDFFGKEEELELLRLESRMLKNELKRLREHFGDDLGYIFYMDFDIIPAKIIFRSPSSWDSSLWINVGKTTNAKLGRDIVAHNSPIVVGKSVVGVVDYVGENQSRVRLITDSGLTPSVRAVRNQGTVTHRLAKGELHGSSGPLWRTFKPTLKGVGFNYDFADEYGPSRDLQSGSPLDGKGESLPIIKEQDLLVTTGLDGVFPPGLQVARVTKLYPLQEGDYYYELEAKPTAGNLDELSYVFVLKPLGYEQEDRPPAIGWR